MILHKSLFDSLKETLWIIKNKDKTAINNCVFENRLSARLLMETKNKRKRKMDSQNTSALTPVHGKTCPFKLGISFLSLKNSDKPRVVTRNTILF